MRFLEARSTAGTRISPIPVDGGRLRPIVESIVLVCRALGWADGKQIVIVVSGYQGKDGRNQGRSPTQATREKGAEENGQSGDATRGGAAR